MTLNDFFLICFAAAAVIHGVQTVLAAKLLRGRTGREYVEARDGVVIGLTTFAWQFGNFVFGLSLDASGTVQPDRLSFTAGNLLRDGSLVCFPLLFASMSLIPDLGAVPHSVIRIGRGLRYPLWPWTVFAVATMIGGNLGFPIRILSPNVVAETTLYIMLLYFVMFAVASTAHRRLAVESGIAAHVRSQKAGVIASFVSVVTFIVMLFGQRFFPKQFGGIIELCAMLSSVPFSIFVAYRMYQFPFMDVFIREVLAGMLLLGAFAGALAVASSPLWICACAVGLAFLKSPVTHWVERRFLGYKESTEQQEERIAAEIRGLTRVDEFDVRVPDILAKEIDAEWIEIGLSIRPGAVLEFEIPGSGLRLSLGPRSGRRQYMSRQLRVVRTAALQLAAHHHQLSRQELKELTVRAQMNTLQAQINPHFLFNTLNVLAGLIQSDPIKAEQVTVEFADIFRYALESTRHERVALDDELRFLQAYLEIEKARFEERLRYSFDVDPSLLQLRIPPMILQPLVENAVKHGVSQQIEGGEVRVIARFEAGNCVIVIEDTGPGRQTPSRHRGAGVGLSNVRDRLQHTYAGAASLRLEDVSPTGTRVLLALPQAVGVQS
jgi:Histidine kinase/Histidine kinase-, DNA gyrase B-, and HSP90-like ATPase